MGEKERNFIVGILTRDEKVNKVLIEKFEGQKNIAIIDLMNMDGELAKKFINSSRVDVVVASEEAFVNPEQSQKVDELIKTDINTTFLTIYNKENSKSMRKIEDDLQAKEALLIPCKVESNLDYFMLATNAQGAIHRKIHNDLRIKKVISDLADSFTDRDEK